MYGSEVLDALPAALGTRRSPVDPFGETADPARYVPRAASEAALREIQRLLVSGQRLVALTAPPGLGKTLLLHLLADGLRDSWRSVHLAYGALGIDELAAWALGLLGESSNGSPLEGLRRAAAGGLLLLVDDAETLPRATAQQLSSLTRETPGLRWVLAASDDARGSRALASLGSDLPIVRFFDPMNAPETRHYVAGRLRSSEVAAAIRTRFDEAALERIHRLSGGNPRRVNELCAELLSGGLPEDVQSGSREDRWLGTPIDDL